MNQVFDDILLDFDGVTERTYQQLGIQQKMAPEDADRIIDDLKEYYYEVVSVMEKRYEEVKVILETYFRQMIAHRRQEIDMRHNDINEEDF